MNRRHLRSAPINMILMLFVGLVHGDGDLNTMKPNSVGVTIERSVPYKEISDRELLADLYFPNAPEARKGPRPALLMIHGGAWFAGNKAHVAYHAEYAATRGYVVMAINYRLAPRHKFPAQLEDCRDALGWLQQNSKKYQVDLDRVGAYGYSAGGHLACLMSVAQNDVAEDDHPVLDEALPQRAFPKGKKPEQPKIRAVVAGGSPCEFSWIPKDSRALAYWLDGSPNSKPHVFREASPIEFVDQHDPPIFLFHGSADRVVPQSSPLKLKKALDRLDVKNELHLIEKGSHLGAFVNKNARKLALDFLDEHINHRTNESP